MNTVCHRALFWKSNLLMDIIANLAWTTDWLCLVNVKWEHVGILVGSQQQLHNPKYMFFWYHLYLS